MSVDEVPLAGLLQGNMLVPDRPSGLGAVVLGGSSGRVDMARARLLAEAGAVVLALRWFGGEGQVPGICEVPLEDFTPATDRLVQAGCRKIMYLGTSKGAEAASLLGIYDDRIDIVVAISPTSVVWANSGPGRDGMGWPLRSSWTLNGQPLPFVPYDVSHPFETRDGLNVYLAYHEHSLEKFAGAIPDALIRVEQARATYVLVAGGDDMLWPSDRFAAALAERLDEAGKEHFLLTNRQAGHRVLFPGELATRSAVNAHGGSDEADRQLGQDAWDVIQALVARLRADG
ncbi:MAG: acyl-CoA thioesterase [Proteobacteria bacterium]|nr:acyl-CoA thioesterase [Pseudomonadota bacterium]